MDDHIEHTINIISVISTGIQAGIREIPEIAVVS